MSAGVVAIIVALVVALGAALRGLLGRSTTDAAARAKKTADVVADNKIDQAQTDAQIEQLDKDHEDRQKQPSTQSTYQQQKERLRQLKEKNR